MLDCYDLIVAQRLVENQSSRETAALNEAPLCAGGILSRDSDMAWLDELALSLAVAKGGRL